MSIVTADRVARWAIAVVVPLVCAVTPLAFADGTDDVALAPIVSVKLWDTVTPIQRQHGLASRSAWRSVAAGGPLRLRGDLVVETRAVAAAFASHLGKVLVYSRSEPSRRKAEVRPAELLGKPATLASTVTVGQNGVVTVQAAFNAAGQESRPITFTFTGDRILAIMPRESTRGVGLAAPMELAMVPSFVGEDLIYDPRDYPAAETLSLPSEHFLLGLLAGESSMLVMTWQEDIPSVHLSLSRGYGKASIGAVSLMGGKGISLAVLDAPGIWHRESLTPSMLEREVSIAWKPPFPAVWLTQLYEDEVKTTFEFRRQREDTWRGGVGFYKYPTWFSHGKTMLSLGKKIPPEGEAIIYFLERNDDTPKQVVSPIDIAQRTLTGDVLSGILDVEGRPSWFPERPDAVIGAATCATTDALKAIFDAGQELEKQAIVKGGVEDMYFYLEHMFERDARFYPFAEDMLAFLDAQAKEGPELTPYLHELRSIAEEMITTYDNARDTIRDMSYAHELGDKTIALAAEKRPDNRQQMADLKQSWTGMGGALEELARKEHTLARKLYQQAGYGAAVRPQAMPVAEEIRRRAKQCLERPESYEMWENY